MAIKLLCGLTESIGFGTVIISRNIGSGIPISLEEMPAWL